jgi:hypothetical protein
MIGRDVERRVPWSGREHRDMRRTAEQMSGFPGTVRWLGVAGEVAGG